MLRYVLIVNISCNLYNYSKKNKTTHTLVWVKKKKKKKKKPKLCHKCPAIYLSLGKGRESLHLISYEKLSLQVCFLTSPAHTKLDKKSMTYFKIAHNMYIFMQISCLSRKQKGMKFSTSIPDQDPSKKAHPQDEI